MHNGFIQISIVNVELPLISSHCCLLHTEPNLYAFVKTRYVLVQQLAAAREFYHARQLMYVRLGGNIKQEELDTIQAREIYTVYGYTLLEGYLIALVIDWS